MENDEQAAAQTARDEVNAIAYPVPRTIAGFVVHPVLAAFPEITGPEMIAFGEHVATHGVLEPIVLDHLGRLVDGRARAIAAGMRGLDCPEERLDEGADIVDFVLARNLHRRHLNESQRAMIAARIATIPHGGVRQVGNAAEGTTQGEAAQRLRVSKRSTTKAKLVISDGTPEQIAAIDEGRSTISAIASEIVRARARRLIADGPIPLPDGPFAFIDADPPWAYTKREGDPTSRGLASAHFDPMPLDDIRIMGDDVTRVANHDAILSLWTTNPHLLDGSAHSVIASWDFEPKTMITWDKNKIGTGDWARAQTEHVILCLRKGAARPRWWQTFPSTILRGEAREHSRKPESWYELLERMLPANLPRLLLFTRARRPGWITWGAEEDKFNEPVQGSLRVDASTEDGAA